MKFTNLKKTSIWNALSSLGRDIETPQGIFYWSSRAKTEAEIDGTIGIAQDDDGVISHLKSAETWAGKNVMDRLPKAKIFSYAPIQGLESLRKKWLKKLLKEHPSLGQHATMPVVTNGITHALDLAGRLLMNKGETIVTADKSWENYEHIFSDLQGINLEFFELFTKTGEFNVNSIIETCRKVAAKQSKVVLLLNFPHNQTGFMPSSADFEKLAKGLRELCESLPKISFVVILDDAYEGYVYDDKGQKLSPASKLFITKPNFTLCKMDGISKALLAYGYRVAFITFFVNSTDGIPFVEADLKAVSAEICDKIGAIIRGEISQVNHHGQVLADALLDDWETVESERGRVIGMLKERWNVMMKATEECYEKFGKEKIWVSPCNGGFFGYFNVAKGIDPKKIADRLLREKKVGVVPSENGMRVAFCAVAKEKIPRMMESIFEVANNISSA